MSPAEPKRKPTRFGSSLSSSLNPTLSPKPDATPLTHTTKSYFYREYDRLTIFKECWHITVFGEAIVVSTDMAFEVMAVKKRFSREIPESHNTNFAAVKRRIAEGTGQPLGIFRLPQNFQLLDNPEDFICVYEGKHSLYESMMDIRWI